MASPFVFVLLGDPTAADIVSDEAAYCIEAVGIDGAAGARRVSSGRVSIPGGEPRSGGEVGTGEGLKVGHGVVTQGWSRRRWLGCFENGFAVGDLDGEASESVIALGHTGSRHRVGDEERGIPAPPPSDEFRIELGSPKIAPPRPPHRRDARYQHARWGDRPAFGSDCPERCAGLRVARF